VFGGVGRRVASVRRAALDRSRHFSRTGPRSPGAGATRRYDILPDDWVRERRVEEKNTKYSAANAAPTEKMFAAWIRKRQRIDAECVGEMNALKAHCFNRTVTALGRRAKPYPLKPRHRAFKHIFRFTHAFDGIDFGDGR